MEIKYKELREATEQLTKSFHNFEISTKAAAEIFSRNNIAIRNALKKIKVRTSKLK